MNTPIHATLTAEDATRREWDAVVAGAGVAGAALAASLAADGRPVLLLDKATFPRAKTCGGTLNTRAVASLGRLGLGDALAALQPNRLVGVAWRQPSGATGSVDFGLGSGAVAVSREALDAALVGEAIARGAHFLPNARCVSSHLSSHPTSHHGGDRRVVRVRIGAGDTLEVAADVVLACDGLGSYLAADAGLAIPAPTRDADYIGVSRVVPADDVVGALADRILMAVGERGYAGVVRVEGGRWEIAAAIRLGAMKGSPGPAWIARETLASVGVSLGGASPMEGWTATRPRLERQVTRPGADRLLLVGDAAGYSEPITGEGMAWALRGVESVREALRDGWSDRTAAAWERAWRRDVRSRQWIARLAGRAARSAVATSAALASLRLAPGLGRWIAHALASEPSAARGRE